MIEKCSKEDKKCAASRSGLSVPSNRTQHIVKRNIDGDPRSKASDISKTVDVSPRTAVSYSHKLGYCGRVAKKETASLSKQYQEEERLGS